MWNSGLVYDWEPLEGQYNSTVSDYLESGWRSKASSYVPGLMMNVIISSYHHTEELG